jgi:hypothetical protein
MAPIRYDVPEDVLSAHLEGEAVLLNVDTKNYYRLNDTAAHVFQGVERGLDRDGLLNDLCATFDVSRDTAAEELDRLLGDLAARGLLRPAGETEADAP